MPWVYVQSSGKFYFYTDLLTTGYSGRGDCKNKPEFERKQDWGPIPAGKWSIGASKNDPEGMGPLAIALSPIDHTAWGRTKFYIHGDNVAAPGTASEGCIILPPEVRVQVNSSTDKILHVVATDAENPFTYKWSATEVKPQATPLAVPTYHIHGL